MTKGDLYHTNVLSDIIHRGYLDENPRPHYSDGTPAHTLSINGNVQNYDLSKNESPIVTLRPTAVKGGIKEILWIYQDQSNSLDLLENKYDVHWWNEWDIGDRTIGCRYGATIKRWDLMNRLLKGLVENPFHRRHIMCMWQEADFNDETGGTTKGLNPCCYETIWNVRKASDGLYLDMTMNQRSSDYVTSCSINELQYIALLLMVARHCGYKPGVFTHVQENVQIYDRHVDNCKALIKRTPYTGNPHLILDTDKTNFYDFTVDDFKVVDNDANWIKQNNPQMKFDLGI